MLSELSGSERDAVARRWLELMLEGYGSDGAAFFASKQNAFANPVGVTFAEALRAVLDQVLDGIDARAVCARLEEIIKIRAVQEMSPAEAISFVFMLKEALHELHGNRMLEADPATTAAALRDLDARVEQIALFAFDIYVMCREKVYGLRVAEIRKGYVNPD